MQDHARRWGRRGRAGRGGGGGDLYPLVVDVLVIHASRRFFFGENETVWGSRNVALVFFEETSDGAAAYLICIK